MNRPLVIGLTGSIGMGKTTTSKLFKEKGIPVWSADEVVHRLYSSEEEIIESLTGIVPEAILNGAVNREILSRLIAEDKDLLPKIEGIVHPLVAKDRDAFVSQSSSSVVLVDIPLLLEGNSIDHVDVVVVVSTSKENQQERVLRRPGMTMERFELIKSKQMSETEKRKRADFVIDTTTPETAAKGVSFVLKNVKERIVDARDRS